MRETLEMGNSPFPSIKTEVVAAILIVGLATYGSKYVQDKGKSLSTKEVQLSKALSNEPEKGDFDLVEMPNLKQSFCLLYLINLNNV